MHSWNTPPSSLMKGVGVGPSENWVTCGGGGGGWGQNVLLERGNKPVKGAVDVEMGGLPIFYYFTVQSYLLCVCVCQGGGGRGRGRE